MIRFIWAKLTRNDALLQTYSLATTEVIDRLDAKRVAIVGNARALENTNQGSLIDEADIVVRINSAPMPRAPSHGERTDWLAISTPIGHDTLTARNPSLVLWMTRKRRRLSWALSKQCSVFINPVQRSQELSAQLGTRPTTGLMIIDLVSTSNAKEINLFGFDFFASLSLSGARTQAQVPHDFPSEQAFVEALIARDPRVHLHKMT